MGVILRHHGYWSVMDGRRRKTDSWHLNRSISIAFIGTLLLQTAGDGWWLSSLENKVAQHDKNFVRVERELGKFDTLNDRMTRVEVRLDGIGDDVRETKEMLK